MSEIKINIQEAYLPVFLEFLQTLSYVKVKEVAGVAVKQNGAATDSALRNLPANDPLRKAIIPMRKSVSVADLLKEQGYQKTDWTRLQQLAKDLDIKEPIEDLLAQLTA